MPQEPHGEARPVDIDARGRQRPHLGFLQHMLEAQKRERDHVLREVLKAKGLMPLLMKQRNGNRWSAEERRELLDRLNALSQISPYLVAMAVPGSMLMLPVLAWWLDRRRGRR
ncbi:MAG: hypothetical protein BroJett006_11000 [Betaproteobacteria bacterium]|jgi:hypothetical protein|nr:MAG: hypothetical protein BroJett006_11000 [Betaproteobacteria bacterium]